MGLKSLLAAAATAALVLTAAAASVAAAPATAEQSNPVLVYFTRGELFAPVRRDAGDRDRLEAALAEVVSGPTRREYRHGLRSSIPAATRFLGVALREGVATVDLSSAFARGRRGPITVNARLAQVVFTATQFAEVRAVRILLDGKPVDDIQGVAVDEPLERARFGPQPQGGAPAPPPTGPPTRAMRRVQERLMELGYLPPGRPTGVLDEPTRHATLAFQAWEGLRRDGIPGPITRRRLAREEPPEPSTMSGRRIEVHLRRQVALLIAADGTVRAIHVSTGAASSPTPPGSYRVYRKERRSWSVPFRQWLPWASYFTGGIAFHEYASVPAYPASHGCVRVPAHDARLVYRFARLGTRVLVL